MANILPPCKLIEVDLAGTEAVDLGWFCARLTGDPMVIRFAKLGLHALVTSHVVGQPVDTAQPDAALAEQFKYFKKHFKEGAGGRMGPYEYSKRVVHGTGYGLTPEGMSLMFPEVFATAKEAEKVQRIYFDVCPPVPAFQLWVKKRAAKYNLLGGPVRPGETILTDLNAHPFTYQHEFFNVVEYRKLSPAQVRALRANRSTITVPIIDINGVPHAMKWGPDSKRALAFYPQSTTRGKLAECEIELFDDPDSPTFIATFYYGRTPLRAPIHDSLFLECPFRKVDELLRRVFTAMLRPVEEMPLRPEWGMGAYLTTGAEAKIGNDWEAMEDLPTPTLESLGLRNQIVGVASDSTMFPAEESEEEEVSELRTAVA